MLRERASIYGRPERKRHSAAPTQSATLHTILHTDEKLKSESKNGWPRMESEICDTRFTVAANETRTRYLSFFLFVGGYALESIFSAILWIIIIIFLDARLYSFSSWDDEDSCELHWFLGVARIIDHFTRMLWALNVHLLSIIEHFRLVFYLWWWKSTRNALSSYLTVAAMQENLLPFSI